MNNSHQLTNKNNCIIFGNSDIANFIIESLLNSKNNYNITLLSEESFNTKFNNDIYIIKGNIYDPKILNELDEIFNDKALFLAKFLSFLFILRLYL